jgi:hypothetical protein
LKAKRFTATRRQHGKHILARERIANDLLLQRPKGVEPEVLFERSAQIHLRAV